MRVSFNASTLCEGIIIMLLLLTNSVEKEKAGSRNFLKKIYLYLDVKEVIDKRAPRKQDD